jgi:outer membrane autotransporter protein
MDQLGNLIGQRLGDLEFSSAAENGGSSTGFRVNRPDSLTVAMDQSGQSGVNALNSSFTQAFAGTPSLLEAAAGTDGGIAAPIDVSAAMGTMLGGWGGFFSASSINGQSKFGGKDNNLDGYAMMVGLDRLVNQRLVLGAAFSATETNVDVPFGMGGSRVRTYQGTVYGTWSDPETMVFVNGFAGWGSADISTHRTVTIGGTVFSAMGSPDGSQATAGLTVGKAFDSGDGTWIYPRAGVEYDYFHTGAYTETGSVIAMSYSADTTRAFLGRIGVEAKGDYSLTDEATVHPSAHADLVGNLGGGSGSFLAAFAAAPGGVVRIDNAGRRDAWVELGAGLSYDADASTTITLGYDATLGRSEADYGAVTGRIAIRF